MARDGEEGLELYRKSRPDLVLISSVLPKLRTPDVIKGMQAMGPTPPDAPHDVGLQGPQQARRRAARGRDEHPREAVLRGRLPGGDRDGARASGPRSRCRRPPGPPSDPGAPLLSADDIFSDVLTGLDDEPPARPISREMPAPRPLGATSGFTTRSRGSCRRRRRRAECRLRFPREGRREVGRERADSGRLPERPDRADGARERRRGDGEPQRAAAAGAAPRRARCREDDRVLRRQAPPRHALGNHAASEDDRARASGAPAGEGGLEGSLGRDRAHEDGVRFPRPFRPRRRPVPRPVDATRPVPAARPPSSPGGVRAVPAPAEDRRGRHGRGLQGAHERRTGLREDRRDQAHRAAHGDERRLRHDVRRRGEARGPAQPQQHHPHLRSRQGRRLALHRHGVRRGQGPPHAPEGREGTRLSAARRARAASSRRRSRTRSTTRIAARRPTAAS